ncbi:hypothetical protein C8Q80DRAFT_1100737 [Daedaleopsis nitida]|nr:hypothetical protein C8Q80DRAFT_1100737 [Daedaleopsis nitida]
MCLVRDAEVAGRVASRSCLHTARGSPKSHLLSRQTHQSPPLYHPLHPPRVDLYLQGPQGDPFPEPPPVYVPVQEEVPKLAKPLKKRKRPPARESACQFCKGHKSDKDGNPEQIVSCTDCGLSGHPSCMGLRDVINTYDWQCHRCKSCSACFSQDSEASMLICDFCDRGWHMACFEPPYEETPEGRWHCVVCPPVHFDGVYADAPMPVQSPEIQEVPPPYDPVRQPSVASSSHYIPPSDAVEPMDHALTTDASEIDVDPLDPTDPTPRRSTRKREKSRKGKEIARDDADLDPAPVTSMATTRRLRLHCKSPPVENETPPTIRLRVPARGKGKAREDPPEEHEQGLFDEILSVEDRDVRDTTIGAQDHERFERSRSKAEVRSRVTRAAWFQP